MNIETFGNKSLRSQAFVFRSQVAGQQLFPDNIEAQAAGRRLEVDLFCGWDKMGNNKTIERNKKMVAMLSKPKKMPGDSFNISAFGCVTGQKLAKIKGSVCYDCYAMKGAYPWPVVQNAMQARLDFLNSANFAVDMAALLNKSRKDTMRWFDSGDVRSVAHCLKIIAVCRLTPNKKHWIPTKERKFWQDALKIEALPDNAVVRYSATMVDDTPPEDWEHSSSVITGYNAPVGKMCEAYRTKKNGQMISHDEYKTAKKEKQLGKIDLGYCGDCRACWSRQVKTVCYPKH